MVAAKSPESPVSVECSSDGLSFRAPTTDLKRATAILARIAPRKHSYPVLAHAALHVHEGGRLELVATDLNVTAIVRLSLGTAIASRPGGILLNAKQLHETVKNLPTDECSIARKTGTAVSVTSGSLASILPGLPDRDFPKVPDDRDLAWHPADARTLADALDRVLYAVCKDETRFHLNGVKYECPDGEHATFIATDGHRLALVRCDLAGAPTEGVIIPSKGATEIRKLLATGKCKGTCDLAILKGFMFARYGSVTLAIKLTDAQFPPYEQVIPKDHSRLATIERKPLIAALKRAAAVCTETRGVKLTVRGGKLTLTSDHPEFGESSEDLIAESAWCESGGQIVVGVNARYLIEAISVVDCQHVTLAFGGPGKDGHALDPILVRTTEDAVSYSVPSARYLNVTMPMRI